MRAIGFRKFGGPEVLEMMRVEDPRPEERDVIIRTLYTSVNRLDVLVRKGFGPANINLPHVPGCDLVGTVEGIGAGIFTDVKVGDVIILNTLFGCSSCFHCKNNDDVSCKDWKVLGMHINGAYGELVRAPARAIIRPPRGYRLEELACMPMSLSAAWRALCVVGKARKGESVLIWGATGGVGRFAVMIAKAMGLKVLTLSRGNRKRDALISMGADKVMDYDGGFDEIASQVMEITKGNGVDLVIESFGGTLNDSIKLVRTGGRIVLFGTITGLNVTMNIPDFYRKGIELVGIHGANSAELMEALEFISRAGIRPVIAAILDIDDAAQAHKTFENSELFGKIVLKHYN